jgi:hypothetical protein
MTIEQLSKKRKEKVFYKIQVFEKLYWKELPKIYGEQELARTSAFNFPKCRIVKRTDKGWEIMETIER